VVLYPGYLAFFLSYPFSFTPRQRATHVYL
jgi:hypothetical protein